MSDRKTVEFRIQKINADSPEGRLIAFLKQGNLGGVSVSPVQIALTMLSMCLQPFVDRGSVSDSELKKRTAVAVELLLLHCKNLCSLAGLDFAYLVASGGNVSISSHENGNKVSAAGSFSTPLTITSPQSDSDNEEDDTEDKTTFSMSNANYGELDLNL